MLNNNYGAKINLNDIPFSYNVKNLFINNSINLNHILNCGDDYELILVSEKKFRKKIVDLSKKNKVKIRRVGVVTKNKIISDDSNNSINLPKKFDHFR